MKLLSRVAELFLASALAPFTGKPRVTPFFSSAESAPAFIIECLNTTDQPIMSRTLASGNSTTDSTARVPARGVIGPGLGMPVQPGQSWRGILTLSETPSGGAPGSDSRRSCPGDRNASNAVRRAYDCHQVRGSLVWRRCLLLG